MGIIQDDIAVHNDACLGGRLDIAQREQFRSLPSVRLLQGNSADPAVVGLVRGALAELGATSVQLLVLHRPYDDIIRFSDSPDDLSNAGDTAAFLERFAVLVIGDKYAKAELVPLGFLCLGKMNEVGFRTKALVVKNIEGNEIGKGRRNNLWRYRALAGGFYIFKHEYVIVFRKPGPR